MAEIVITDDAQRQAAKLPKAIRARLHRVVARLAAWPAVSGAKPLRGGMAGQYRLRSGDYRIQFRVAGDTVTITKIGHRDGFYDA
jgi:mRNA-degrading endonuclease RelE of RelBE toxin-antitoxin system